MRNINLQNYAAFEKLFQTARSPAAGKPLRAGYRLFKDGSAYVVSAPSWLRSTGSKRVYAPLLRITPDDKLTFVMQTADMLRNKYSLSYVLGRFTPLYFSRRSRGVYTVMHGLSKSSGEYTPGLMFDMTTGLCLNAPMPLSTRVIPEVRRQWLRDLKRWKRGIKTRVKLGILAAYRAEEKVDRKNMWRIREILNSSEAHDALLDAIRKEDYPESMMRLFAQHMIYAARYGADLDVADTLNLVDLVFDTQSLALRKSYGVFAEETS